MVVAAPVTGVTGVVAAKVGGLIIVFVAVVEPAGAAAICAVVSGVEPPST